MKKDILLLMSDQHNGFYTSLNKDMGDITPNLKRIAQKGVWCDRAYCNSPLCVPSRTAFLTGKLPSENGVLDNMTTLNSDEVTIAHKLGLEGYDTVLVGRMHFMGLDQFHGFDERYVGDITNQYWGMSRKELGDFHKGFSSKACQEIVGEGETAIVDYDYQVFQKAMEILNRPRKRPLFLLVGFYQPHYPYVSYTLNPGITSSVKEKDLCLPIHRIYCSCRQETTLSRVNEINIRYKNMVKTIDSYIGKLFDRFTESSDGLFIYTSDHGDQLGKRGIFGKRTLYEDSVRVPLVLHGCTIEDPSQPISLVDLHHLLTAFAKGSRRYRVQGPVICQSVLPVEGKNIWLEMVCNRKWKLENLNGEMHLYDIEADSDEQNDLIDYQESHLQEYLKSKNEISTILHHLEVKQSEHAILKAY